ncbi:MAG: LuxR C-terminal-related transcriptional regulator [Acidimicrobiales bacterium]
MSALDVDAVADREPLVKALLAPPRSTGTVIPRERLIQHMERATQGTLTLVSGEPAAGKTTLTLDWLSSTSTAHRPQAWLTVTDALNDSVTFWEHLVAAVESFGNDFDDLKRALLDGAPNHAWLTTFANRLGDVEDEPIVVIDDLHELDLSGPLESLHTFVERLPASVHVIALTRTKPPWPLERWLTSGRVSEVGSFDLRFTLDELRDLIESEPSVQLTDEDLSRLHERTEGWAGGIKLALLSMRRADDHHAFIARFAADDELVSSYLFRDVLDCQSPDVREFLLDISVLDRFTPELCDTLRERQDSLDLVELCRSENLFVVELEDGNTFRLHALFRQLLQFRLGARDAERLKILNCRASIAYEGLGDIGSAVRHSLLADDHGRAGGLIARYAADLAHRGRFDEIRNLLVPLSDEEKYHYPQTALGIASTLSLCGRVDDALETIDRLLAMELAEDVRYSAHQVNGFVRILDGRLDELAALVPDIDRDAPGVEVPFIFDVQRFRHYFCGLTAYFGGDMANARERFENATNIQDHKSLFYVESPGWLSRVHQLEGKLSAAERVARESLRRRDELGSAETAVMVPALLTLAEAAWERNDLDSAERHVKAARRSLRPLWWETVLVEAAASRISASRGQLEEALAQLLESVQVYLSGPAANALVAFTSLRALELAVRVNDVDDALRWAQVYEESAALPLGHALRLQLEAAQGRSDLEEKIADALNQPDERAPRRVATLLVSAQLLGEMGNEQQCLNLVAEATSLAEQEGLIRRFLDAGPHVHTAIRSLAHGCHRQRAIQHANPFFLNVLESALDGGMGTRRSSEVGHEDLIEPLSDRELEVLDQLAGGLSYREIGTELFVSRNTVKSHVRHVYTKLGVASRAEAIQEARRLGLI